MFEYEDGSWIFCSLWTLPPLQSSLSYKATVSIHRLSDYLGFIATTEHRYYEVVKTLQSGIGFQRVESITEILHFEYNK